MNGIIKITAGYSPAIAIPSDISPYTEANGMTPALGPGLDFKTPVMQTLLPEIPPAVNWPAAPAAKGQSIYPPDDWGYPRECWFVIPERIRWPAQGWPPDSARLAANYLRTAFIPSVKTQAAQPDLAYDQARHYALLKEQARITANAYVRYANLADKIFTQGANPLRLPPAITRARNASDKLRFLLGQPAAS